MYTCLLRATLGGEGSLARTGQAMLNGRRPISASPRGTTPVDHAVAMVRPECIGVAPSLSSRRDLQYARELGGGTYTSTYAKFYTLPIICTRAARLQFSFTSCAASFISVGGRQRSRRGIPPSSTDVAKRRLADPGYAGLRRLQSVTLSGDLASKL